MSQPAMLTGAELVLCALVPKGKDRWDQVHMNRDISEQFFFLRTGGPRSAVFERVDDQGILTQPKTRKLVYSEANKNYKIEFDFSPVKTYPTTGIPILLVVALDVHRFRYRAVMPGQPGYKEMLALNEDLPSVGRGHRRVITTLDEVELRWPGAHLRKPRQPQHG